MSIGQVFSDKPCSECKRLLTRRQVSRGGVVCSRRCAGLRLQRTLSEDEKQRYRMQAAWAVNHNQAYQRVVREIIADVKAKAQDRMVTAADAVKIAVKWRRIGYDRGYGAAYRRHVERRSA